MVDAEGLHDRGKLIKLIKSSTVCIVCSHTTASGHRFFSQTSTSHKSLIIQA